MTWWRAPKRPEDHALEPAGAEKSESETPVQQDPILLLQRAIGNHAVQKMLPRSEGEPIAPGERAQLESSFGQDLGEVRIHRDQEAADLTSDAGASAVTTGRDIYFAPGAYGSARLAHEVTHAVQQSQASSFTPGEDATLEHQANAASSAVMAGQVADISSVASAPAMQRQPAPGTQPPLKISPTFSLTLDGFDIDRFALSATHKQKLDEFALRLKNSLASAPDSMVTIVGFADAPGTEPHNLALGQQRADTVRGYLVDKGISARQLHAASLGEGVLAVASKGYESKNRRVEISVVERNFFKQTVLPPLAPAPAPTPAPPVPAQPAAPAKPIDLTYHPHEHEPTPEEDLQERMSRIDQALREAKDAEKAKPGTSLSDLSGRLMRNVAKKIGLPKWVQDKAESIGKDLPAMGAKAVVDQIAGDSNMDSNTKDALKAIVDAMTHVKVK